MKELVAIVLAGGEGTRMKSRVPKVLHKILGKTLLTYVLDLVKKIKTKQTILVIGHKGEEIKERFAETGVLFALQEKQLGSGDALGAALGNIPADFKGSILVLCGDTPLLREETISKFISKHQSDKNDVTILTCSVADPFGYGRIKRDEHGVVSDIVEEKACSDKERGIKEINTGVYAFSYKALKDNLGAIKPNKINGEYYLTDIIKIIYENKGLVGTSLADDISEVLGINDRVGLSEAYKIMNNRINTKLAKEGVTILAPGQVYIEDTVSIGKDTEILPGTMLYGDVRIGEGCTIGPNTVVRNSKIGDNSSVIYSYVSDSNIGDNVKVGPFSHIRPGTKLANHCKVGNFTEVKNVELGEGSKASHLSYLGDSKIGKDVNIGAGTITCNYDGKKKHKTVIEDRCFIGSNTNIVAPVVVGSDAVIAAGSTIYEDVPSESLAIARSYQVNKEKWTKKKEQK